MQFLNRHGLVEAEKTARTTRKVNFLFQIHILCWFLQYFPPFVGHFEYLKMLSITRILHLKGINSKEDHIASRYQEVKTIKIFYAAHISRSQAKSMFGNWTMNMFCIKTIRS